MFNLIERGETVGKAEFDAAASELRTSLILTQQELRKADCPVLIIFGGVDGAGKSELAGLLNEWMDPRWIVTRAYGPRTPGEKSRPEFWRYWVDIPPRGQIGVYLSAWYSEPLVDRVYGRLKKRKFERELSRIGEFERCLADDGALVLKFWMHLDKAQQKRRLRKLEKHPARHWQVSKQDWRNWENYGRFVEVAERIIEQTDAPYAPWRLVDGGDARYRSLAVLRTIRQAIGDHLAGRTSSRTRPPPAVQPTVAENGAQNGGATAESHGGPTSRPPLAQVDLGASVAKPVYARKLPDLRRRLNELYRRAKNQEMATMLVFEGWDAAGKGGTIRRVTAALDARDYRIHPIAAPNDWENAHHYLWRFWQRIPRDGKFAIFDRSWYGRVMVERVEGFASEPEWSRAFREIREFEDQIVEHGTLLMKFWLHIDPDEQARRFRSRAETPYKSWKLTDEDWRNRDRWREYEAAVNEMVARTSTAAAPWQLVPFNDKRYGRLEVLTRLCEAMERKLG